MPLFCFSSLARLFFFHKARTSHDPLLIRGDEPDTLRLAHDDEFGSLIALLKRERESFNREELEQRKKMNFNTFD